METTFELHEKLTKALGAKEAKAIVNYIDNRVKNEAATKVDLKELELKLSKLIITVVITANGILFAALKFFS